MVKKDQKLTETKREKVPQPNKDTWNGLKMLATGGQEIVANLRYMFSSHFPKWPVSNLSVRPGHYIAQCLAPRVSNICGLWLTTSLL